MPTIAPKAPTAPGVSPHAHAGRAASSTAGHAMSGPRSAGVRATAELALEVPGGPELETDAAELASVALEVLGAGGDGKPGTAAELAPVVVEVLDELGAAVASAK